MLNKIWIYLFLIALGLTILVWPEQNNQMLVKFSEIHGPSRLDTIGLSFIMFGYIPMVIRVIRQLNSIYHVIGKSRCLMLMLISGFFLALIPLALYFSYEALLWVSVAISTVSQAILIYYGFRTSSKI